METDDDGELAHDGVTEEVADGRLLVVVLFTRLRRERSQGGPDPPPSSPETIEVVFSKLTAPHEVPCPACRSWFRI